MVLFFLTTLAWIAIIFCPVMIWVAYRLQKEYKGSLEETMDMIHGYVRDYEHYSKWMLIIALIALAFLIARYLS